MKKSFKNQLKSTLSADKIFTIAQHIVPQQRLSETAGRFAASRHPLVKKAFVHTFAKAYGITLDDYERKSLNAYESFNDFFTRELTQDARPIDEAADSITSPADGIISQLGQIEKDQLLQAKGRHYSIGQLLADQDDAKHFIDGSFATVYLAPSNYHRVHMPFDGKLIFSRYIPGSLFSVNNTTAEQVPDLFARNERLVCLFETDFGIASVVMVGAMIVAGIETVATGKIDRSEDIQTWSHELTLSKGDELGRFYLGSTAIVLLPQAAGMKWQSNLQHDSTIQMGKLLGKLHQR
ncbi:MAG: archaetidylserine decarboxylase [Psychrobacter sp.]|nr:archaetidylserine decarboxylase [Psychrobacter sp.]